MQYKIINEQPWQILSNAMTISPSETGYELQVAADGKNYTTLFSVGAGLTRQITNLSSGSYYRMKGNVGEVTVNWVRDCSGGEGGGGSFDPNQYYTKSETDAEITAATSTKQDTLASGENIKTINNQSLLGSGNITIEGTDLSEYYTKAQTDAAITAATEDMATKTWVGQQGYLTEHQDISGKLDVSTFNTYTGATETVLEGKADISDIPSLDGYWTSAQTNNAITAATNPIQNQLDDVERVTATALTSLQESKQETLVSGTNIKTINNQSLLGSGNIDIQGGGGGDNVVELTKAQYEALDPPAADTTYIITDADVVDLNDYAPASGLTELSGTVQTLSTTVSGKADKQNVTARTAPYLPSWNAQGIITGSSTYYQAAFNMNGTALGSVVKTSNSVGATWYAPTSAGTAGQPLLSNGSGAPVWGNYKFAFISQSQYDALTTPDATTIYFIVDPN